MRRALQRLLEPVATYRVIGEAGSAEAALEQLTTLQVDLCLVDLSLPGMNGIQLIQKLQDQEPALRCLVVTGHNDPMYEAAALSAGAAGYVTKGDPEAVLEAVRRVLGTAGGAGEGCL
jgi:DNA-binding NarL/FixJ family response regulator